MHSSELGTFIDAMEVILDTHL